MSPSIFFREIAVVEINVIIKSQIVGVCEM